MIHSLLLQSTVHSGLISLLNAYVNTGDVTARQALAPLLALYVPLFEGYKKAKRASDAVLEV